MTEVGNAITLNPIQRAGYFLGELLNLLYPPPPNPDIITLEDVLNRYRLTGLGVPAITALQQARRIVRTGKDYCQIGLCEFHIGLIYLHWQHCLAAAQQFAEARRQWLFADETASVCLTYFAEGLAQHHALHYESAMGCYHKAEQWLPRLRLTPPSEKLDEFVQKITSELREAQETLRDKMWPADEPEKPDGTRPAEQPTAESASEEAETADRPSPESETEAPERPSSETEDSTVPPPRVNIIVEQVTPEVSSAEFSSLHDVPLPIRTRETADNAENAISPDAYLLPANDSYKWYQVVNRYGDFLPFVREGTWVLVDTRRNIGHYEPDDLVILGGNHEELQGNIPLHPYISPPAFRRIYLSLVQRPEIPFIRDQQSGRVKLVYNTGQLSTDDGNVLGMVLGFWVSPFQINIGVD